MIFAIVIPLAYPFMVPLGLHWPINAIMLINIQTLGYDFIQGPMGAWNFACFGATAGVLFLAWRERDAQMRQTATGALAAGLLGGISEPSLYGIHLRFKRIYPRMLVGCFVGGLIIGTRRRRDDQRLRVHLAADDPGVHPIGLYAIAVTAAFVTAMILVILSGYRTPEQQAEFEAARVPVADLETAPAGRQRAARSSPPPPPRRPTTPASITEIASPLDGTVVPLADVPDPVFSRGTMGPGVAIDAVRRHRVLPRKRDRRRGPADGSRVRPGARRRHRGADPRRHRHRQPQGRGLRREGQEGPEGQTGTPLVTFDRKIIEDAGYSMVTPVIVLNWKKFASVDPGASGPVAAGDPILEVAPKPAEANV